MQDAARGSLLRKTRADLHGRIAKALQGPFNEVGQVRPELVAQHLTEAGENEQAVGYWLAAGRKSGRQSAYLEAEAQLVKALKVLSLLPRNSARDELELAVQTSLATVYMATKGYASPEAAAAYRRAREVCDELGDADELFKVLLGLRYVHQIGGHSREALGFGNQCLDIARKEANTIYLVQSHAMLCHTEMLLGHFSNARAGSQNVDAEYETEQHAVHTQLSGLDPGVFAMTVSAWSHWFLGYPDEALKRADRAIALAQELDSAQSLEHAWSSSALTFLLQRNAREVRKRAETARAIALDCGFTMRVHMDNILLSWCETGDGNHREAEEQLTSALEAYQATGARAFMTYFLAVLADIHKNAGDIDRGLAVTQKALSLVDDLDEYWWQSELLRRRGEMLIGHSAVAAESVFREALAVAREQGAKMWEIRTATSLGRLLNSLGRKDEARDLLAPIYDWFTEGFDAPDLKDARELLGNLK